MFRNVSQIESIESRNENRSTKYIIIAISNDTKTSTDNMRNVIKQKT
jgi:hypothetical protein